jgi:hypothetical protein
MGGWVGGWVRVCMSLFGHLCLALPLILGEPVNLTGVRF